MRVAPRTTNPSPSTSTDATTSASDSPALKSATRSQRNSARKESKPMGDDRPTRYIEERDGEEIVVYRASGLGACPRVLHAYSQPKAYLPEQKPEWFQAVLDEGTAYEDVIRQAYVAREGVDVVSDQQECELELGEMFGRTVIVRGHTDGSTDHETARLFEAKKFRHSTWPNFLRQGVEVNQNYPWQVSVYMLALDLDECDFVGGHLEKVRNDKGDEVLDDEGNPTWELTEIHVEHLAHPPINLKAIRNRIYEVEKRINVGLDAKEVECNRSQYPCPFFKLHDWPDDTWEWDDPEQAKEADAWMASLAAVDAQLKETNAAALALKAKKDEVAKGLREFLGECGVAATEAKQLLGSEYTVTHVTGSVPSRVQTVKGYDLDYFKIAPIKSKKGDKDAAS